jgi:hypothetical protein
MSAYEALPDESAVVVALSRTLISHRRRVAAQEARFAHVNPPFKTRSLRRVVLGHRKP